MRKRKTKAKELFFVIGGGINRTKCLSAKAAVLHATRLIQERPLPNQAEPSPSKYPIPAAAHAPWIAARDGHMPVPKIESRQCTGSDKPLYVVKVIAIVDTAPVPVQVRKPGLTDFS